MSIIEGELVAVTDLKAGDLIDLEGDLYARCGDDCGELDHSCVFEFESVRVGDDFDVPGRPIDGNPGWWIVYMVSYGWFAAPNDHKVKRVGHLD